MPPGLHADDDEAAHYFATPSGMRIATARVDDFPALKRNQMPRDFMAELTRITPKAQAMRTNSLPHPAGSYVWRLWKLSNVDLMCEDGRCDGASITLQERRGECDSERERVGEALWFAYPRTMQQFHHFMMEWLPNLAFLMAMRAHGPLDPVHPSVSLIVDEWALSSSFVREALSSLRVPSSSLRTVPRSGLCTEALFYPEKLAYLFGAVAYPAAQLLRSVRAGASRSVPRSPMAAAMPTELLFIDRMDAPRAITKRQLTNAREFGNALRRRDFRELSIGSLPFAARLEALAKARMIVMLAGTTQVNTLFAPPHARVLVVAHPLGQSAKWNTIWYSWLCSAVASCTGLAMLNNTALDWSRAKPQEPWRVDYWVDLLPTMSVLDSIAKPDAAWPPQDEATRCENRCEVDAWRGGERSPSYVRTCALFCWQRPSGRKPPRVAAAVSF